MRRIRIKAIVFALAAGLFGYVFYMRYWIWRDCIAASQSSCATPDGSNVTDGGIVWGVIALGFLAAAVIAQFGRR
jgi:cell division protein FtsX